jgi:hypothetical protein
VHPDGTITGEGSAIYRFQVSAGGTLPIRAPGPLGFLWSTLTAIPIGATAMLNEAGERDFTITGQADLEERVIYLDAFQPSGESLKLVVNPVGDSMEIGAWPPMTNIGSEVMIVGATPMIRGTGKLEDTIIEVNFEAVKDVGLESLLEGIVPALEN